ncbi:hypothetical protein RF11_12280 [Thelohanellus kitauei]|uniref:Transposase Tc1-like domain-containing protein n=1 Tax=Thelohanellus kitauei TaxID=669202 RepID=A0A0C2IKJ0_THEKT|nr:hypothetical protein RF11_12280 [Thelohanellus kitauei]
MEININDQPERYCLSFIRTRRVDQTVSNELLSLIIAVLNHGKNFTEKGRIEKLPKGVNLRAKLTDKQKESLCDILEEDCSPTIQRICDLFLERHNIRIGRSTATRCFKDFHYTLKILRPIPQRRRNMP